MTTETEIPSREHAPFTTLFAVSDTPNTDIRIYTPEARYYTNDTLTTVVREIFGGQRLVDPTVQNLGPGTIYIGFDSFVSSIRGIKVPPNYQWNAVYGILTIAPAVAAGSTDVTDRPGRLLGLIANTAFDVTDRVARLLGHVVIDAGTAAIGSITNTAFDVTDRSARLLGTIANTAFDVTDRATRLLGNASVRETTSAVLTGTAAVNTGVTVTLPAAGAGLFHYIMSIQITKLYAVVGVASGTGIVITTTNLNGLAFTTEQLASVAGTAPVVVDTKAPIKSQVANTNSTIVCPVQLQTIWRVNVTYYTGT